MESYAILKVYLHNCLVAIKESRIDSSLLCANLFVDFIFHFIKVTKILLQTVLFHTLYLHVHMHICMAISLLMLVGGLRTYEKMLTLSIWSTVY